MGGSAEMGFIFPQIHPGFDAMFSIAKLIETLSLQPQSLGQLDADLPRVFYKSQTVRCPWTQKGALMRQLVETHPAEVLELIDGVKIRELHNDNWVLVLPDAGDPLVHIYVNGIDREWVETNLTRYREQIQSFIDEDPHKTIDMGLNLA